MQSVKPLMNRLLKYHWSPQPPETYVIKHPATKEVCGIGLVASRDYGAFNLAWAGCSGVWETFPAQVNICGAFNVYTRVTGIMLPCKSTLGELTSLLTPLEFVALMRRPDTLEGNIARGLKQTLNNIERMAYEQCS